MPAIVILFLILLISFRPLAIWYRFTRLRDLGTRLHMEYLKWELMDFPTEILDEFGTWDKAHNVYLGRDGAERFMIFDIERGWGRQAIQRTVIARRYANAPRFEPAIEPPFLLLQSQNWRIVTLARTSLLRKPFIGSEAITPRSIEYFLELLAQAKFPDRRN